MVQDYCSGDPKPCGADTPECPPTWLSDPPQRAAPNLTVRPSIACLSRLRSRHLADKSVRSTWCCSARISLTAPWLSPSHDFAVCAVASSYAPWCARLASLRKLLFIRCLFVQGKGCARKCAPCRGCSISRETYSLGVPAVILFGLPAKKDEVATGAWSEDGIVQQAARAIKREVPNLIIIGDVCLCEYRSEEHTSELQS